ncbi:MAG: substrate-binding domain-containing protein [Bdellovibrionaceae bacterium]|nr:substrate-binding domain-containing protein [Bdellovibrio sp.]
MNKFFVGILVAVSALSVNAAEKKIVITGSSTIAPLAANLAKAFEKKNAGTRLNVQAGGSSRGIADARAGLADIGMVSRALNPDEKDFMAFTVALDGIVIILNKKNLFEKLTNEQIISIYKGETKNCKDVGGKDAPITVVNKAEGRSTLELFLNCFKFKNTDVKAQVAIAENEQGIKTVAGNPNAVG